MPGVPRDRADQATRQARRKAIPAVRATTGRPYDSNVQAGAGRQVAAPTVAVLTLTF